MCRGMRTDQALFPLIGDKILEKLWRNLLAKLDEISHVIGFTYIHY
jgi:hypothetical protein